MSKNATALIKTIEDVEDMVKEHFPNSYVTVWVYVTPFLPHLTEIRARVDNISALIQCKEETVNYPAKIIAEKLCCLIERERKKGTNK